LDKKGDIFLRRYIIGIIIGLLIILGIVLANFLGNNDKEETNQMTLIRLNEVTRSVFYAPQYLAISNGYFQEQGLNIEITTGQGADKVMTAVLAGQSDIGFAGPEAAIYVYNEGKEDYIEVFAQMTKKDGSFLVGRTENKNFKWTDVKGSTIIPGRKGGVPYMTFEYVLKQNGIDTQKDVVLDDSIKFDLMAGAFAGGTAEYVTLFEPTASMTEAQGKGYIIASVGEASGEIPYTAYFAKKSYIDENPEIIQGFTNAIYKAELWVKEHSAKEIAEKIQSFFPDTDLDMLTSSIQRYKDIDAWNENPVLKEESFDKLQTVMQEAGELDKKAPYELIINNEFANKAISSN